MSDPPARPPVEDLLRQHAPQVLGRLVRRHADFHLCEDAVQEALLAASTEWTRYGVPDNPGGWLFVVASRRVTDMVRSEQSRRRREQAVAEEAAPTEPSPEEVADHEAAAADDSLTLVFLCCHPALSAPSQIALTLRALGGLSTADIAAAFFVPEATMAQRISRAKARLAETGARFEMPSAEERPARLEAVMHVLYLIFTEGSTPVSGTRAHRPDLTAEAIRLTRQLCEALAYEAEAAGLLALMLLTEARRPGRLSVTGELVPLDEQDRSRWDRAAIEEGKRLLTTALERPQLGRYQVLAAIAALHDEAASVADTDWPQILALYQVLDRIAPNPMARLSEAVARAYAHGPDAGIALLDRLAGDSRVRDHHRFFGARARILEMYGDRSGASDAYLAAARRATNLLERNFYLVRGPGSAIGRDSGTRLAGRRGRAKRRS